MPATADNLRKALDVLRQLLPQNAANGSAPTDDVAVLAEYVRAEFERAGKSHVFILSSTPDHVLTSAIDHLANAETNGHVANG
jgi:hypothetical protein